MSTLISRFMTAAALSLSLAALGGPSAAAEAGGGSCTLFKKYNVTTVVPWTIDVDAGYTFYTETKGAQLFVVAQPGLTAEWLERSLIEQVADGRCDFGIKHVDVDVLSSGPGFSVRLGGANEREAKVIMSHVQQMR